MTEQYSDGLGSVQLHLVDSVEEAGNFLRWAGERRPFNRAVGLDIETGELPGQHTSDALSPWKGQIRLMQIGDGEQGWAIPWDDWKGVFYEWTEKEASCPIVIHNVNFESKWLTLQSNWDFPWGRCHDTMLMSRVINPLRSAALKTLSGQIVDPLAAAMQGTLNKAFSENGWTWGSVPMSFGPFWQYGALDPVLTMRIFEEFWKDCAPGKRYSIPYELEMAARKVCTQMELNGSRVNLEYSKDMYERLTQYTHQVKTWAKETYGGLSITSNVQLVHQFERLGAEITEVTATGNKSVTKDQLDIFIETGGKEVRDLAEAVLNQRKYDKVAGSYFLNFMKDHVDGVLHPQINTMAARTSRMSVTAPALQTLPSGDPLVRRAFIPREEGQGILSCDLSSAEFRVCTILSEDQALIDLFNDIDTNGGDAFTQIMRDVYLDKSLQKSDPRRKLIKSCVPTSSEILTERGWLTYNQVQVGDRTLGYNLETGVSEWTTIEKVHVYEDAEIYNLHNAFRSFQCTKNHRWVVNNGRTGERGNRFRMMSTEDFMTGENRILLAAPAVGGNLDISPSEASLLGWVLGDGSIKRAEAKPGNASQSHGTRVGCHMIITQTKPDMVEKIKKLLEQFNHVLWINPKTKQHIFTINPNVSRDLLKRAGIIGKKHFDPWALALGLSLDAREAMIASLDDADGKNKTLRPHAKNIQVAIVQEASSPVSELVVALGYLTGKYSKQDIITEDIDNPDRWQKHPAVIVRHQDARMTNKRTKLDFIRSGRVWCVTTSSGSWTMRQENKIPVLTGNSIYGRLFGAGVAKMAHTSGVPVEQMQPVVDAFNAKYPGVERMQREIEDTAMKRLRSEGEAYVITRTGRRLPGDADKIYALMNYLIQGSAAEILKNNLVKIDKADLSQYLMLPIHDEVVSSIPLAEAKEISATIQECMTTRDWGPILIPGVADHVGANWGVHYEKH